MSGALYVAVRGDTHKGIQLKRIKAEGANKEGAKANTTRGQGPTASTEGRPGGAYQKHKPQKAKAPPAARFKALTKAKTKAKAKAKGKTPRAKSQERQELKLKSNRAQRLAEQAAPRPQARSEIRARGSSGRAARTGTKVAQAQGPTAHTGPKIFFG